MSTSSETDQNVTIAVRGLANWCPLFHPIKTSQSSASTSSLSLLKRCCIKIVSDYSELLEDTILPQILIEQLLATALSSENDLAIKSLLGIWKEKTLTLHKLLPEVLSNPMLLGDYQQEERDYQNQQQKIALQKASNAATTLIRLWLQYLGHNDQILEESDHSHQKEVCKIITLDVSGFPLGHLAFDLLKQKKTTKLCQNLSNDYTVRLSLPFFDCVNEVNVTNLNDFLVKWEVVSYEAFHTSRYTSRSIHRILNTTSLTGLSVDLCLTFPSDINLPIFTNFVNLVCLDLSPFVQNPPDIFLKVKLLLNFPKLKRLDLSHINLEGRLSSLLDPSIPLEYLGLRQCQLQPNDLETLPTTLIHLDLSKNNISLLSSLKNMENLSILKLEMCNKSHNDCGKVVNLLISFPRLSIVNLAWRWRRNGIARMEVEKLLDSEHIQHVIISAENIQEDDLESLKQLACARGKTLVFYDSDSDDIDEWDSDDDTDEWDGDIELL